MDLIFIIRWKKLDSVHTVCISRSRELVLPTRLSDFPVQITHRLESTQTPDWFFKHNQAHKNVVSSAKFFSE